METRKGSAFRVSKIPCFGIFEFPNCLCGGQALFAPHTGKFIGNCRLTANDPGIMSRGNGIGIARLVGGLAAIIADAVDGAGHNDSGVCGLAAVSADQWLDIG